MTSILVVTHSASPGGAELGLLRYLQERSTTSEHDIHVLVGAEGWLSDALSGLDVGVSVIPRSTGPLGTLRATRAVRRLVRELAPDLVLSNSLRAATWALAARVPRPLHALYVQDLVRGGYFTARRLLLVERVILPSCGYFLWNSEASRASAPAGVAAAPGAVVYTMSGTRTSGRVPPLTPTDGPLRVLSMSRLAPWKGVHVLLDAVGRARSADDAPTLAVTVAGGALFGEEVYRDGLAATIDGRGLPVRMVGHVEDVAALLEQTDVLVHCSLTPEPFGQVVVQALAAGRAVVATRGGGPAEILRDGVDGLLYEAGDATALAAILTALSRDRERVGALGEAGRSAGARFGDQAIASRIDSALHEAVVHARTATRTEEAGTCPTSP